MTEPLAKIRAEVIRLTSDDEALLRLVRFGNWLVKSRWKMLDEKGVSGEDLVHEAIRRLLSGTISWDEEKFPKFGAVVCGIMRRMAFDEWKSIIARQKREQEHVPGGWDACLPDEEVERAELLDWLRSESTAGDGPLSGYPVGRQFVELFLRDITNREIAVKMGVSEGKVSKIKKKTEAILRDYLGSKNDDE